MSRITATVILIVILAAFSQTSVASDKNSSLLFLATAMASPGFQLGLEYEYRWPFFGLGFDVVSNFVVPDEFFAVQGHILGKGYIPFSPYLSGYLGFGLGAGAIDLADSEMMFAIDANATLGLELRAGGFVGRLEGGYNPFFPIGYTETIVHTAIIRLGLGFAF